MKTDLPRILCVNPWIHDFAAFDFWAKPIGLLSLAAILRKIGLTVSYVDCLNRFHENEDSPVKVQWDGRGPYRKTRIEPLDVLAGVTPEDLSDIDRAYYRYGILPEWFEQDLKAASSPDGPPDLIMVTSMMTYWASGVAETIRVIRQVYPDVPVVLGGVYASLCHEHALRHAGADMVVSGPGEPHLADIVKRFTGWDFGQSCCSDNSSADHISADPVDLDDMPWPALDLVHRPPYMPILTSRGCPFSCEYCASSFLEPRLRRRSPDNVFDEIVHWHQTLGITNAAFYDDALLVDAERYAFPLLERLAAARSDFGSENKSESGRKFGMGINFHTPNALHIRAITQKAADLMFKAGFKTIRLGLETTDFGARRHYDVKVSGNQFLEAVARLKQAGFEEKQIGAYLLCGLPGQDLGQVEASIHQVREAGIQPVLAYYTPIPPYCHVGGCLQTLPV